MDRNAKLQNSVVSAQTLGGNQLSHDRRLPNDIAADGLSGGQNHGSGTFFRMPVPRILLYVSFGLTALGSVCSESTQ
jgi:hypothetical protein